jgi:hypothetical protein
MVVPAADVDQKDFAEAAWNWHHQLLSALLCCEPQTQFHLRYVKPGKGSTESKLGITLIIVSEALTPSAARCTVAESCQTLAPYLGGDVRSGAGIYRFQPLTSAASLRHVLIPIRPRAALSFARRAVMHKPLPGTMTPGSIAVSDTGDSISLTAPLPEERMALLGHFCYLLTQQQAGTMVDLVLRPTHLLPEERDVLRSLTHLHDQPAPVCCSDAGIDSLK